MDILDELNQEQLQAVTETEGFIRVIAGAGSGKTRALTHRFAYLVNAIGVLPGNILCVTFTNKAANEMRRRIHNLTGDNDTGYINTFHGFCVSVLQEESHAVGYPKSFLVLDNSDIDSMLRVIYEERGLTLRDMTFSNARDMIEIQKLFKKPDYYLDLIAISPDELREKYMAATTTQDIIFYGYLYQEKKCFGLDYNDLIMFSLYIFDTKPDICRKWQERLEYIMIDEFQDIDMPQYRLMKVLCGYHKNLFVVGDPDQTIYTWRGANVHYLMDFDKEFPGTKTIMMNRNYRSTPEILGTVNSLIAKNQNRIRKDLLPVKPAGYVTVCNNADNSEGEALWILGEIQKLRNTGIQYRDMAILYRAHYVTRTLEEVFLKNDLPYTIYSGVQFFDRSEIKDALSYLRLVCMQDDLSFERVCNQPKRNLGERRLKFLRAKAAENKCLLFEALRKNLDNEIFKGTKAAQFVHLVDRYSGTFSSMTVSELLNHLMDESGYEEMLRTEGSQTRLDNLAELRQSVYEYETGCGEEASLPHYLAHVALFTNSDLADAGDKVKLMTVHAAKGLEFKNVFLCGLNEGIFPSGKVKTRPAMEEERRLAFVAMTRAEDRLFLSCAGGRNIDGSPRYMSRFLLDIDRDFLNFVTPPKAELIEDTCRYLKTAESVLRDEHSNTEFKEGQRVVHDIIGHGTICSVDPEHSCYMIKFDAMPTERKISFKVKLTGE